MSDDALCDPEGIFSRRSERFVLRGRVVVVSTLRVRVEYRAIERDRLGLNRFGSGEGFSSPAPSQGVVFGSRQGCRDPGFRRIHPRGRRVRACLVPDVPLLYKSGEMGCNRRSESRSNERRPALIPRSHSPAIHGLTLPTRINGVPRRCFWDCCGKSPPLAHPHSLRSSPLSPARSRAYPGRGAGGEGARWHVDRSKQCPSRLVVTTA